MSKVKSEVMYAGPFDREYAGISAQFMQEKGIGFIVAITTEGEGAIMLHPDFDRSKAAEMIPMIAELNQQAAAFLHALAQENGQVH